MEQTMIESSEKAQNVDDLKDCCDLEMLYTGEEAKGFDVSNGTEWVYPTNYPVRKYQKNIVSNALFKNTLVCLPTGLGKTFIAAVVMYNYHRWFPKHIIVFMAHSKPLVSQQVDACCSIMGISPSLIAELNGNMNHVNRKKQWESKKIFFLTPQVFNNDLARGNVKAESIRCIVIDEAHKALGNQAYCQVIQSIKPFNSNFRVLALSATPGDDMNMVKEVIQNLLISHLELRNEDDPDIKPYLHEKKIETIVIKLDQQILDIRESFFKAIEKYVEPLVNHKLITANYSSINPFLLVLKQRQFIQDPTLLPNIRGIILSNFSVAISLFHALEELSTHGMRSFVAKLKSLQSGEGSTNKSHYRIANDSDIKSLIERVESILGPDQNIYFNANSSLTRLLDDVDSIIPDTKIVYSHPKFAVLENIIQSHFETYRESTRVIVFCKSRQCTGEICHFLARFKPLVKPMIFVGQSNTSGGAATKGFNQAAQLTVMKRFREGIYNTLIATCVAEEGLDIGEVDLIINFDSGRNSNTQVQRSGRTGRKRDGRVVNLVTEGKEHQNYNISVSKGKKMNKRLVSDATKLPFYAANPRLIPKALKPVCQEMYFAVKDVKEYELQGNKKRTKRGQKKKFNDPEEDQVVKKIKKSQSVLEPCRIASTSAPKEVSDVLQRKVEKKNGIEKNNNGCVLEKSESYEFSFTNNKKKVNVDLGEISTLSKMVQDSNIENVDPKKQEKSSIVLYDDDVDGSVNKPWESLLDAELQANEKNLVIRFLRNNSSTLKPKNNFRKILNLKKLEKYYNLSKTCSTELTCKIETVEKYTLDDLDKNSLLHDELDVDSIVNHFNEVRRKSFENKESDSSKLAGTVKKTSEINIEYDINPEDFMCPFDDFVSPSKPHLVSSTPVRSVKDNKTKVSVKSTQMMESNFHLWDENDFSNLKDPITPQKESNSICPEQRKSSSKHEKTDMSMISITQALDIVNKASTNIRLHCNVEEKNNLPSPSSPVLFCSQKPKTQVKYMSGSPILTQKIIGKQTSRKSLNFKDHQCEVPASKDLDEFNPDNSDLFAETELALQNHLLELENNLKALENNAINSKEKQVLSPECFTVKSTSSNRTVDYNLEDVNFDENSTLDQLLKTENKLIDSVSKLGELGENKRGNVSENSLNEKNTTTFINYGVNKKNEIKCSGQDFRNISRDSSRNPKPMENTPIKPPPKMAVVRPLGFENMPLANSSMVFKKKVEEEGGKNIVKPEKTEIVCNFSLFGDEDFGEDCFNMDEKINVVEEENKTIDKSEKVEHEGDETSNDSDIFVNKDMHRDKRKSLKKFKDDLDREVELFKNMSDDGDFSDGAIEAIKAVEMYEKDIKLAKSVAKNESSMLRDLDSDDSEDFFVPIGKQTKQLIATKSELPKTPHMEDVRGMKKKVKRPANTFIENEAEISDCDIVSSDEENTSGLDEYDSSFVDEREVCTQAHDVDMTAKYLQSTKSPLGFRPGAFKIPKARVKENLNVFSQIGSEGESDYEHDSFCVPEEGNNTEVQEISELEIAEVILQDKKKRKRARELSIPSAKKHKMKRVFRIESDSSEDEAKENLKSKVPVIRESDSQNSEIQELFNSPFPCEVETSSSSNVIINNDPPAKLVLFVASRQIASAPEITTCLRAKYNVNVQVRSAPEADYIISWRVGGNRIQLSDFASGNPSTKNSLKDVIQRLSSKFLRPVLIVEDDKNKGLPTTVGSNKIMWAKHSYKTIIKVHLDNIKIMFSRNKDDTARILMLLCKEERKQGHQINLTEELSSETERTMKFYSALPGVNVANAFRLTNKFSSISSFIKCCDSVQNIMRELGLKRETAIAVYQVIFTAP